MGDFFTSTLPSLLTTYAQYRLQSQQIKAGVAQTGTTIQQTTQTRDLTPFLLLGAGLLAVIVISKGK